MPIKFERVNAFLSEDGRSSSIPSKMGREGGPPGLRAVPALLIGLVTVVAGGHLSSGSKDFLFLFYFFFLSDFSLISISHSLPPFLHYLRGFNRQKNSQILTRRHNRNVKNKSV